MLSSVIGRSHQGRKVASYHLKKCPVGERRRQIHRLTGSTQTCNGDSFNSNHSQLRKGPYFYSLTTLGLAFAYLNAKERNFRGSSSKMFCSLEKVIENQPEGLTQEQSVGADKVENNEQENDESWVENDWSDLPAEDEDKETSCFICLVNREGPCKNYWRRFELCMDANPGEDDEGNSLSTKACEKPFMAWMQCQHKHQEYYRERAEIVEYQLWTDDVLSLEDDRESKTFPTNLVPVIEIGSKGNEKCESGAATIQLENLKGKPLVIAYVKDERGKLLSFGSKKKLSDAEEPGRLEFDLKGVEHITIHAVYEGEESPIFSVKQKIKK